jgi:hypothetical protein
MKVNLKRILLIIMCAELMIWYWARLEVENTNRQIVYQKNGDQQLKTPPQADQDKVLKEAS